MKLLRPMFAEAKSPRPFLHLLVFSFVTLVSGCEIVHPTDSSINYINEHRELVPEKVCRGDRLKFNYEFYTSAYSFNEPVCPRSLLPSGVQCESFYPIFALAPSSLFSTRLYPADGYRGSIESDPLTQDSPFEFAASIDSSSPSFVPMRGPGTRPMFRFAFTSTDRSGIQTPEFPLYPVLPPFSKQVDPIDAGQTINESVTFTPQCAGNALAWTPVSLETGTARSASVGLTQICNRDRMRSVRYLITFESAPSATTEPIAPGECVSGMGESSTFRIRSLSVIPGIDPTVPVSGPPCFNSMNDNVPAPVVAQLSYACSAR